MPAAALTRPSREDEVATEVEARLAGGTHQLPLLPQVAAEVLALSQDPRSDSARLCALVQRDQSLAGHVLRLANSATRAARSPVVSLQQAVARLGMREVAGIAVATSLRSGIFQVAGHETRLAGLWTQSLATAAYAREVARLRRDGVESAYLCGLLHAVGKPVVLQAAAGVAEELGAPLSPAFLDQLIEAHYLAVGARVAARWNLPAKVAAAIAWHGAPEQAADYVQDAATTQLAAQLAAGATPSPSALLNLYPEDLAVLVAKAEVVRAFVEALS